MIQHCLGRVRAVSAMMLKSVSFLSDDDAVAKEDVTECRPRMFSIVNFFGCGFNFPSSFKVPCAEKGSSTCAEASRMDPQSLVK